MKKTGIKMPIYWVEQKNNPYNENKFATLLPIPDEQQR